MIYAYLNGELNGDKLKTFEQTLYAYELPEDIVLITTFDFKCKSAIEILDLIQQQEEQLRKTDFFFIGQLKRREHKAQKHLYDKLYPKIRNHILRNSGNEADVHDFTQEVIIKLYDKLKGDTRKITTLEGFAFGILRNTWLKELDKRKRHKEKDHQYRNEQETVTNPDFTPDNTPQERTRILRECLNQLKPEQKEFLEYYDLQCHNIKQTALHFQLDEVSVRVRANRCRNYLKKKLEAHPEYNTYF